jgi:hypothetical protein
VDSLETGQEFGEFFVRPSAFNSKTNLPLSHGIPILFAPRFLLDETNRPKDLETKAGRHG